MPGLPPCVPPQGDFGVEPGVGGKDDSAGIAGTVPPDAGASAVRLDPVAGVPSVLEDLDLPRDEDEPGSDEDEDDASGPKDWTCLRLVITTRIMAMRIQTAA